MFVRTFAEITDLEPYSSRWDELAGACPFRSWTWLSTWWKHFGESHQLRVLAVFDDNRDCLATSACRTAHAPDALRGILPLYVNHSPARGRVLRLLSDGEVCSEHLDLLSDEDKPSEVAAALASHLVTHAGEWDLLQLTTLVEQDRNLGALVAKLCARGCRAARTPGTNLWSIPLPASWEEFLAMQSKSHRKQIRQLDRRVLEGPRACWIEVCDDQEFDAAWPVLVDLHQRRRQSLGEPGCFASRPWASFHYEVARKLLADGMLRLSVLTLDDRPIAAEYHLCDGTATYAYQGGLDPDRVSDEPGQLAMILCVKRAIADRHERFELLRGDEPYKAHWRAVPSATADIDIIPPRPLAYWRHLSWRGLRRASRMVRQVTHLLS